MTSECRHLPKKLFLINNNFTLLWMNGQHWWWVLYIFSSIINRTQAITIFKESSTSFIWGWLMRLFIGYNGDNIYDTKEKKRLRNIYRQTNFFSLWNLLFVHMYARFCICLYIHVCMHIQPEILIYRLLILCNLLYACMYHAWELLYLQLHSRLM